MTNFSHPQCYARSLSDCSNQLSREHYVSASVLKLLGEKHVISQASWLSPGQYSKLLPVDALGSNVLCERHNRALSDFDSCAKMFFGELLQALSKTAGHVSHRRVSVDGDKLEQWVLKAYCGALASGNLKENGHQIVREPPLKWLSILFSGEDWESSTGLHIRQASITPHQGYSIDCTFSRDGILSCKGKDESFTFDFSKAELQKLQHIYEKVIKMLKERIENKIKKA